MPATTNAQSALEDLNEVQQSKLDQALGEFKGRARSMAHETMESLRSNAGPYVESASQRLDEAERYVVERVQKQPLTSVLAALGAGVILGLLLAGGRSR